MSDEMPTEHHPRPCCVAAYKDGYDFAMRCVADAQRIARDLPDDRRPRGRPWPPETRARTVSLAETAAMLGIGRSTMYKLVKQGVSPVPVLQIGPALRVSLVHLDRYLETGVPVERTDG